MIFIIISQKELDSMPLLNPDGSNNGSNIYIKDINTLIKIFDDKINKGDLSKEELIDVKQYIDNVITPIRVRNIRFFAHKNIPHVITPKEEVLVKDTGDQGYTLDYLKDAKTFRKEVIDPVLPFELKLKAISNVYDALRNIHQYGTLGDVHLDNFMFNRNGEGFIIDIDDIRMNHEIINKMLYLLKKNLWTNPYNKQDQNEDNIKASICALSFIYGIDFEKLVRLYGLNELCKVIKNLDIKEVDKVIKVLLSLEGDFKYFDELLPLISSDQVDQRFKTKIERRLK